MAEDRWIMTTSHCQQSSLHPYLQQWPSLFGHLCVVWCIVTKLLSRGVLGSQGWSCEFLTWIRGKFSGAVVRGILANEFFIPRQFYVQEVNELLKFISVPSWTDLMSFPSLLHSKALFLCLFISFKMHWRCILLLIIWNIRAFVPQWPLSIHVVRQTDRQIMCNISH